MRSSWASPPTLCVHAIPDHGKANQIIFTAPDSALCDSAERFSPLKQENVAMVQGLRNLEASQSPTNDNGFMKIWIIVCHRGAFRVVRAEAGFLGRCQKSAPRQSTGFKWRGSRGPHLRTSDRIESSSSRKFSSPIMTPANRTGITQYSNSRLTNETTRHLRKANPASGDN